MKVVAFLTDPPVVDKILRHLRDGGGHDPFEPRAPPPNDVPPEGSLRAPL